MAEMRDLQGQRWGGGCFQKGKQIREHSKSWNWARGRTGRQKGLEERKGSGWQREERSDEREMTALRWGRSQSQGHPWGAAGAESGQQGPRRR